MRVSSNVAVLSFTVAAPTMSELCIMYDVPSPSVHSADEAHTGRVFTVAGVNAAPPTDASCYAFLMSNVCKGGSAVCALTHDDVIHGEVAYAHACATGLPRRTAKLRDSVATCLQSTHKMRQQTPNKENIKHNNARKTERKQT